MFMVDSCAERGKSYATARLSLPPPSLVRPQLALAPTTNRPAARHRWDAVNEECVYRKCDEQCPDGNNDPGAQRTGRNEFEYEGAIYKRQWWCCNDRALCNGA